MLGVMSSNFLITFSTYRPDFCFPRQQSPLCYCFCFFVQYFTNFGSLRLHELQHTRLFCPSLLPRVSSNSCPLNPWHYLNMSPSAAPLSFWLQSFPTSGFCFVLLLLLFSSESVLHATTVEWLMVSTNNCKASDNKNSIGSQPSNWLQWLSFEAWTCPSGEKQAH